MNASRKIAIAVGALFLAGYVGVFGGGFLAEPILTAPDFPLNIAASRSRLISGMLVELLVNDAAVLGIGVLLFQILRVHSETIAIGYLISGPKDGTTHTAGEDRIRLQSG